METLVKILAATAILGVLTTWITYGILAWLRESAPWLLTERRLGFEMPMPPRKKTRLVPRGWGNRQAAAVTSPAQGSKTLLAGFRLGK